MHIFAHLPVLVACASIVGSAYGSKIIKVNLDTYHKYGELSLENLEKHVTEIQIDKGVVPMRNFDNMYYTGRLDVGSPPQSLYVIFDSGSSDLLMLAEKLCHDPKWKEFCSHHKTYDSSKSETHKKTGKRFSAIHYRIEGVKSVDTISVGNLSVTGQTFGAITKMNGNIFSNMTFDGIFGLAYRRASELHVEPPFINMVKQGVVDKPVYSLYLTNCTCNCSMNQLMFGGVDPKHYKGDIIYTDVIERKYFTFKIEEVKLRGKTVIPPINATLCSGCSMTYGPKEYTDNINKAIGAEEHGCMWSVDCDKIPTLPDIEIIVGGTALVLKPRDYTLKLVNGVCRSVFVGYGEPHLILGVSFMRPYLTVYDMGQNRVGFAKAK